jgi:hypothetical protein
MAQDDLPEPLLAAVDQTRRAFVRRMVIGSGFVSPLVSSFAMGGAAYAQVPGSSNITGPIKRHLHSPAGGNTGGPIGSNFGVPVKSNVGHPIGPNIGIPIGSNTVPTPSPSPPPAPPPSSPGGPPTGSPGPSPGPSGAVPEPASALLLGSGVALAGGAVLAQRVRARVRRMLDQWAENEDTPP